VLPLRGGPHQLPPEVPFRMRSNARRPRTPLFGAICGSIHYSTWQNREGVVRYGCEIIGDRIDFF